MRSSIADAAAVQLLDVGMVVGLRQHARDHAALLGHAHALGGAQRLRCRWLWPRLGHVADLRRLASSSDRPAVRTTVARQTRSRRSTRRRAACRRRPSNSPRGGRPRESGAAIEPRAPARCLRPTSRNTARTPSPARRRRCRSSSRRASRRRGRADATATDRISASSAAMRDMMKPISRAPMVARWASDIAVEQHALDLVLAPAAMERGAMQRRDRGGVARRRPPTARARRARTGG